MCVRRPSAAGRATFGVLPRTLAGRLTPGGHLTFHAHRGGLSWRAFSSGSETVQIGKHKGKTFEELATHEPKYCEWVLKQVSQGGSHPMWDEFVRYLYARQGAEEGGSAAAAEQKPSGKTTAKSDAGQSGGGRSHTGSADGSTVLDFGKHRGRTYQEMLDEESNYCQWVLDKAEKEPEAESSEAFKHFLAFLRANMSALKKSAPPRGGSRGGFGGQGGASRPQGGFSPGAPIWSAKNQRGPLVAGQWMLGFGKHQGKTFEAIFNEDQQYCEWIAKSSLESEDKPPSQQVLSLIAYCQDRWLRS